MLFSLSGTPGCLLCQPNKATCKEVSAFFWGGGSFLFFFPSLSCGQYREQEENRDALHVPTLKASVHENRICSWLEIPNCCMEAKLFRRAFQVLHVQLGFSPKLEAL